MVQSSTELFLGADGSGLLERCSQAVYFPVFLLAWLLAKRPIEDSRKKH